MIQPTFSATVKKGKLVIRDEVAFNAHLWKMKEGEEVKVSVIRKRKNRSTHQNAYYWGVILPVIAHESGHSIDELHEIFKRMFLVPQEIEYRGKVIRIPGSTANLSIMEFSDFCERVRAEAATMGIAIPDPD